MRLVQRIHRAGADRFDRGPGGLFLLAGLALSLVLGGCAGLDAEKPDTPGTTAGPCSSGPEVLATPFSSGFGPVGGDTTLEVATWNLENFPGAGSATVELYRNILQTLNLDVVGVEEISDTTAFRNLVNSLPNHGGVYSPDTYGAWSYQKTGIIWNRTVVTLEAWGVPAAFDSNLYNFPDNYLSEDSDTRMDTMTGQQVFAGRPPLEGTLNVQSARRSYRFHLIVMHLKAGTWNADDQLRRRGATYVLHRYVEEQVDRDPLARYVLVGDWNDLLTDIPRETNTFRAFLDDPDNYRFLTQSLVGVAGMTSHPNGLIDHIMVNVNACPDFCKGRITVLPLKTTTIPPYPANYYLEYGSDHVPVVAIVPGF